MVFPGWTPLHAAACFESPDAAKLLLERGAAINVTNNQGKMSLMTEY